MSRGIPTKTIGAVLGMAGFVIAIVAGMAAGNEASTTLLRAIIALVGCNAVGLLVGAGAERVIHEHITDYQSLNPVDDSDGPGSDGSADEDDGILVA